MDRVQNKVVSLAVIAGNSKANPSIISGRGNGQVASDGGISAISIVGSAVPVLISLDSTVSNRGTELIQLNLVTASEGDSTIGVILAGSRAGIGLNLIAVERGQLGSDNFLGCQSNSVDVGLGVILRDDGNGSLLALAEDLIR